MSLLWVSFRIHRSILTYLAYLSNTIILFETSALLFSCVDLFCRFVCLFSYTQVSFDISVIPEQYYQPLHDVSSPLQIALLRP